ncbi:MAG: sulfatase-like hydrolase/transferase, partial [Candidatus Latescibacteria bacterium]|nr:sulfatase-like hydrolase/transferase [Candidatus Latescibacterota bacterium]
AHAGLPAGGGRLVINGPFKAIHSLAALGRAHVRFYPWEEALATVREMLLSPEEETPDPAYPLFRRRRSVRSEKPNVVVVMLEGWPAAAVDSIRTSMGQEPLGLTPEFDRLAGRGCLFTRFYACGRRTRNGLSSMVAGMPSLPNLPFAGKGLEEMRLPYLGRLAREMGYGTYYFSGAGRESQSQHRIAKAAGFTRFTFMEDLPEGRLKAWDHDLWAEFGRVLSEAPEPFLAFLYTTNTHAPYQYPPKWEKHPPDTRERAFWNALAYSDHAMGEYFRRAEKEPYFDRTIFFLAADHTQRGMRKEGDPRQEFHVPCLLIGPGVTPGAASDRVGSQVDTIPTLAGLAGWEAPQGALGRSILDDAPGRGAVCNSDDLVLRVEAGGWVLHNLEERIDAKALREGTDLDAIERRLLAYVQVAFLLWVKDRLIP